MELLQSRLTVSAHLPHLSLLFLFVVVETWPLGALGKGLPSSASTLPGLVVRTESSGYGSLNSCCRSATACGYCGSQFSTVCVSSPQLRAFWVDCRVELISVSPEEGV